METVTHAPPVTSLETLDVEGFTEDYQAQQYHAEKTEINPPQYVAPDFQSPMFKLFCIPSTASASY